MIPVDDALLAAIYVPPTANPPRVGLKIGAVTRPCDPAREPEESPRAVQMLGGRVVRELGEDGVWRDV